MGTDRGIYRLRRDRIRLLEDFHFGADSGADAFDQALEHCSGAYFAELGGPVREHVLDRLGPADRGGKLLQEVVLDALRIRLREGGDILVDGAARGADLGAFDGPFFIMILLFNLKIG